jgi:hypothetical protein
MVAPHQANPQPHPVDYAALGLVIIGAVSELTDMLPAKYSGLLMAVALAARIYTKWLGSRQDGEALAEGQEAGQEFQTDIAVMKAVKAEPVDCVGGKTVPQVGACGAATPES